MNIKDNELMFLHVIFTESSGTVPCLSVWMAWKSIHLPLVLSSFTLFSLLFALPSPIHAMDQPISSCFSYVGRIFFLAINQIGNQPIDGNKVVTKI